MRLNRLFITGVLSFVCIFHIPIVLADGRNILNNGSFDGDYRGDIANGWKDNSGWADLKLKYDEETKTAHAGKAQKIDCLSFRFGAVQFVQPGVSLVKGRSYEIRI